jgi:hypothetical protein
LPPVKDTAIVPECLVCRGLRVYCCPTAANPSIIPLALFSFLQDLQEKQRADERTRTANVISLRVITQALHGFARGCKARISKGVSFLRLDPCCTVLRSRWCQSGIRTTCSPEFANSKKASAACLFLPLQGVGYGLLESHRAALSPRLFPCFLSHAQAHMENASVSLGEEVGVSCNAFCFV